ncbi:hypothetical protein PSACC_00752 [Paramicrosporidium saccamoebae]|uniref:CPL domain-containing protein n=1 Tax=Paramicrosporidium saccamoebae TaxID=1246581 RepID=A0A2H9TNG3_9FUNG|nr:hypothetical protein PSACC_00752 [Paramicrosporidium saccamoebae]
MSKDKETVAKKAIQKRQPPSKEEGLGKKPRTDAANRKSEPVQQPEEKLSRDEYRKRQMRLRQTRRMTRPYAALVQEIAPLWDVIKQKNVKTEEKARPIAQIMELIKGRIKELAQKSDATRMLQHVVTYANAEQRASMAREVSFVAKFSSHTHGMHFLKKLAGDCPRSRDILAAKIRGEVSRMLRCRNSCLLLDEMYRRMNSTKKMQLLAELYSSEFATLDIPSGVLSVGDLVEKCRGKRDIILENLRNLVKQLLNKELMDLSVVQRLIDDYVTLEVPSKLTVAVEPFLEHVEAMVETCQGSNAVVRIIAAASAKDRKQLVKTFKPHVPTLARSPYGLNVLIALLSYVDDTVLLGKAVVQELASVMLDLVLGDVNVRLVLFLLAGRQGKYITTGAVSLLNECDAIATSKKDPETRKSELLEYAMPSIKDAVEARLPIMIRSKHCAPVLVEFCQHVDDAAVSALLDSVLEDFQGFDALLSDPAGDLFIRALIKRNERHAALVYQKMSLETHLTLPSAFLFVVMLRHQSLFETLKGQLAVIEGCESEAAKLLAKKLGEEPKFGTDQ